MAAGQPAPARRGGAAGAPEDGWECRRFEVGGLALHIRQDLRGSNALRPLDDDRPGADSGGEPAAPPILTGEELANVGRVVWQAGFVLADLLLRRPPFGAWHGTLVLDLGCGTGLVGLLLALAGAEATLTDQPHILPLADANLRSNLTPGLHRARLVGYTWGQGDAAAALLRPPGDAAGEARGTAPGDRAAAAAAASGADAAAGEPLERGGPAAGAAEGPAAEAALQWPDVITAADVVYQPERYAALAATLRALAAPHTLVYVAFKRRGLQEESFLQLLEGAGFALQPVPEAQLAPEYRGGAYAVVRACRIE